MSFSADWLALRADADTRARNIDLAAVLRAHFADRSSLRVLDLGSGTGANLRATTPVLGASQYWCLIDNDPTLLATVSVPNGVEVETMTLDLAGSLAPIFDPAPDLVTASAFFDLCGADIARRLVDRVVASGAAFYTVLTYDGREQWSPPHEQDAAVLTAFLADQHSDKGLGPALGPDATEVLARAFEERGYAVSTGRSDWLLHKDRDDALIAALAEGSAAAVRPALGAQADAWLAARRAATQATIGHLDLLALPKPADI